MRIVHTADWHLGQRLGRVDRSDDLRRAVGRVMEVCDREGAEVLIVAGDLFDSVCRVDDVCAATGTIREAVGPFLRRGGTILAVTGNHDGETFCRTIGHALGLVDPSDLRPGDRLAPGRFHLATRPALHRLADGAGGDVQFALMPYPLASRYLDDAVAPYRGGAEGKHRRLREAFAEALGRMRAHPAFEPTLPSVLVAHLFLRGASMSNGYTITEADEAADVVCPREDLGSPWAYVALGHVHRPQALGGLGHVRYSGSVERLHADERHDAKGVLVIELGPGGLRGEPAWVPLESTPFLDVEIRDPSTELVGLEAAYPDAARALVRCRVTYTAGRDDVDAIHRRIDEVFPRCYRREVVEASRPSPVRAGVSDGPRRGFRETVLEYLKARLEGQEVADAVLAEADELIAEVGP